MPKLPGVNHLDAVRALEKAGFWIARQGKHVVMRYWNRIRHHLGGNCCGVYYEQACLHQLVRANK